MNGKAFGSLPIQLHTCGVSASCVNLWPMFETSRLSCDLDWSLSVRKRDGIAVPQR